MTSIDPQLDIFVAGALREAADTVVMPPFAEGRQIAAYDKTVGELVTEVDRACERFLAAALSKILPGISIIGEEAAHEQPELLEGLTSGTTWVIDPIDGTANYASGQGPFGIMVALVSEGVPVAGWIFDPLKNRLCSAIRGKGAKINGQELRQRSVHRPEAPVAVTRLFHDSHARTALIDRLANNYPVIDAPRCAADIYPAIALGELRAAVFTRTIAWDHAAGIVFLNEAGGVAARPDGSEFVCSVTRTGAIAATDRQTFAELQSLTEDTALEHVQL